MAKEYFEDIENDGESRETAASRRTPPPPPDDEGEVSGRSIRNVAIQRRAATPPPPVGRPGPLGTRPLPPRPLTINKGRSRSRLILWALALVAALVLMAVGALFVFARTVVEITPRTHAIVFDPTTQFTAYPDTGSATGTITYTVETVTLEDSEAVEAKGSERVEERASGSITVYNSYSDSKVRLIKNTRFEAPNGLIYRVPSSVEVPGRRGSTPGEITISVIADAVGPEYNIGPVEKFTLPGLKSTADMYAGVYAKSSQAFAGGFVGERPAVEAKALESARSAIRSRLQEKARASVGATGSDTLVFPELTRITFESLPTTSEPNGGARVHERAVVVTPVINATRFSSSLARAVSADAGESAVTLEKGEGFAVVPALDNTPTLGTDPVAFGLTGQGKLVWTIDGNAIKEALVGRNAVAFESIVSSFPGVDKAHAKIAPFWSSHFPNSKDDITVELVPSGQ